MVGGFSGITSPSSKVFGKRKSCVKNFVSGHVAVCGLQRCPFLNIEWNYGGGEGLRKVQRLDDCTFTNCFRCVCAISPTHVCLEIKAFWRLYVLEMPFLVLCPKKAGSLNH